MATTDPKPAAIWEPAPVNATGVEVATVPFDVAVALVLVADLVMLGVEEAE